MPTLVQNKSSSSETHLMSEMSVSFSSEDSCANDLDRLYEANNNPRNKDCHTEPPSYIYPHEMDRHRNQSQCYDRNDNDDSVFYEGSQTNVKMLVDKMEKPLPKPCKRKRTNIENLESSVSVRTASTTTSKAEESGSHHTYLKIGAPNTETLSSHRYYPPVRSGDGGTDAGRTREGSSPSVCAFYLSSESLFPDHPPPPLPRSVLPPPSQLSRPSGYQNGGVVLPRSTRLHYTDNKTPGRHRRNGTESCHVHLLWQPKVLLVLLIVSITLSLLCGSTLAMMWFIEPRGNETCLPCLRLIQGSKISKKQALFNELQKRVEDDDLICCANTMDQMSALVQLLLTAEPKEIAEPVRTLPPEEAGMGPELQFTPVSAHKRLLTPANSKSSPSPSFKRHTALTFNSKEKKGEHTRGVIVNKNKMVIRYSGWYYVYTSVKFLLQHRGPGACNKLKYQTWQNFIKHIAAGSSHNYTLTSASTQCCDNCTIHDTTTYSGGVFRLDRGDRLYVTVSGAGLAQDDSCASYMGIVMLGSAQAGQAQSQASGAKS